MGAGRHLPLDMLEQGLPLLHGVFIPDTPEPPPSRELDVSVEEEIETHRNLEGSQMAQNPCISERSGKAGSGDPCWAVWDGIWS